MYERKNRLIVRWHDVKTKQICQRNLFEKDDCTVLSEPKSPGAAEMRRLCETSELGETANGS